VRKVSGRHQITSDGKHLIDGCTFGRPKPRGPIDRPAIEIPPRKRRRLTYDVDTDSSLEASPLAIEGEVQITSDQDGNRQLVLSADFEDDDMDDDVDFEPDDEEEDEELEALIESDEQDSDSDDTVGARNDLANISDDSMKAHVQKLREAFPKAPVPLCEHILRGFDGNLEKAWEALTAAFQPAKPKKIVQDSSNADRTPSLRKQRSSVRASSKNMTPTVTNDKDLSKVAEDIDMEAHEESSALVSHYDKHGLPRGSISIESGLSRSNRNVRFAEDNPMGSVNDLALDEGDDEDDEDFDAESSSTNDTDSSEDTSSDSSDVDDTSSSGSSSGSDSEPDEVSSKPSDLPVPGGNSQGTSPRNTKANQKPDVPPGQGKRRTQSRNQRRRNANLLQRFKNKGILPAGTTLTEFNHLDLNKIETPEDALEELAKIRAGAFQEKRETAEEVEAAEFESRRQQLLAAIASGGVEVGLDSSSGMPVCHTSNSVSNDRQVIEATLAPTLTETDTAFPLEKIVDKSADPDKISAEIIVDSTSDPPVAVESGTESPTMLEGSVTPGTTSRPRKKLDLGAAGRLLFGALGVRAPKTKADHDKVRNDLVKDIRQTKSIPSAEAGVEEKDGTDQDADPEAWREVIALRAVECCHDGIELSPAPFPFVQRWDVQQQGSLLKRSNRGGKGKKNQRNQPQYYDEEQQVPKKQKRKHNDAFQDSNEQNSSRNAKVNRGTVQQIEETDVEPRNDLSTLNLSSDAIGDAANDQIMRDVQDAATGQGLEEDDLPKLPEDISSLPDLIAGNVKTGMVIAFKQLILSEATNWQPQMSGYRTAVIIKAFETGQLELTLAKRDREERQYDEETGERIWGKFDLPDDDEEDDEGADGFLSVTLNELVEPKIVQQAPEAFTQTIVTEVSQPQGKAINSTDDSTTLGHENSAGTLKESMEMPQNNEGKTSSPQSAPHDDSDSLSLRGGELSANNADEILAMSISEDTREEISELIREAGFRSSVPSSVLIAQPTLPTTPKPDSVDGSYSPKFNGFDSSQSIQAISSPSHFKTPMPQSEKPANNNESDNQDLETAPNLSSSHYPQIQAPPSLTSHSQVSDRGRQPDFPTPGDDTLHQFDDMDSFLGDHGNLRVGENEHALSGQPASTNNIPKIKNSPLGALSESDSSSSVDFPTLDEIFSTARSSVVPKQEISPWRNKELDPGAERIAESYNKAMEALDAELDAAEDAGLTGAEDPEPLTPKAFQQKRRKRTPILAAEERITAQKSTPRKTASQRTASQKAQSQRTTSQETTSQKRSSSFMIPPGSQQVDLTLSSDVDVEVAAEKKNGGDESYDDDFGLPTVPGWAEKTTRNIPRKSNTTSRPSSQMTSKARSSRRRTTTRF
jgi:hypothetical protein